MFPNDMHTIQDFQAFHRWLDEQKGFDPEQAMPMALEAYQEELGSELADCLAYIFKLANYTGVNLQEAYLKKMEKNSERTWWTTEQIQKRAGEKK